MSYRACRRIVEEQHRRMLERRRYQWGLSVNDSKDDLELSRCYHHLRSKLTQAEQINLAIYRVELYEQAEADGLTSVE